MEARLYNVVDTGKVLGVNKNTVYELIRKGHLKALKLGSMKVPSYELEDFMKRNLGKDFTDLDNVQELYLKEEANEHSHRKLERS